jgi:hypothetical protein
MGHAPLETLSEYSVWIVKQDVKVLVLDERLGEQATDSTSHVDYRGHQVVDYLRKRLPTFPIFILTAFPNDEALVARFGSVEGILDRSQWSKDAKGYIQRMVRAGERFAETYEKELSDLSKLAAKAAAGSANAQELQKMRAMQVTLGIVTTADISTKQSSTMNKLDEKLKAFDKVVKKIEKIVEKGEK